MPSTCPAQTPRVCAKAIPLRRSFLRYRPSVSRSGRGVADESLTRLRTASHRPTRRANKSCHASCCRRRPKDWQPVLCLRGSIGEASHWLRCYGPPRCRSPPLIRRGAWKEEKRCARFRRQSLASGCKCSRVADLNHLSVLTQTEIVPDFAGHASPPGNNVILSPPRISSKLAFDNATNSRLQPAL